MLQRRHSLPFGLIALVAGEAAVLSALFVLFSSEMTALEIAVAVGTLVVFSLGFAFAAKRLIQPPDMSPQAIPADVAASPAAGIEEETKELGTTSRTFERLSHKHLHSLITGGDKPSESGQDLGDYLRDLDQARAEADGLRTVVTALDGSLRRLASGDLTIRLDTPFPEDHEGLRSDFNHSIAHVEDVIGDIAASSSILQGSNAELQAGLKKLMQTAASQNAAIARTAADTSSFFETIRQRELQTDGAATVGHNARLDLFSSNSKLEDATSSMEVVEKTSARLSSMTDAIMSIAFKANILAMNVRIKANEAGASEKDLKAIGAEFHQLAEDLTTTAKETAVLSRQTTEAAARGSHVTHRASGELSAMAVYIEAMQERLASIADVSIKEKDAVATLRSAVMTLAKTSREQVASVDYLCAKADAMSRDLAVIDQQASRFTPVRTIQPQSIFKPQRHDQPKPGSHLRLVKT
jgi:methyl-accepting chemotaxis protein